MEATTSLHLAKRLNRTLPSIIYERPPQFPGLAAEIIELIASYLEYADIFSLRLVCVELQRKTFHYFSHNCFSVVHTDFSRESLEKLKDLSQDNQIKNHVRRMVLKGASSPWAKSEKTIGEGFVWKRNLSGQLVYPLPGAELLADILCNLVNCRSFQLCRTAQLPSTPRQVTNHHPTTLTPLDAVSVFQSIIFQKKLVMTSFDLELTPSDMGLVPSMYAVSQLDETSTRQTKPFQGAWTNLQELVLKPNLYIKGSLGVCVDLITNAKILRKLTITSFVSWDLSKVMDQVCLKGISPNLEELHINSGTVEGPSLLNFLASVSESLRVISFHHVHLHGGSWSSIIKDIKTSLPNLQDISVCLLTQRAQYMGSRRLPRTKTLVFPALYDNLVMFGTGDGEFEMLSESGIPDSREYMNLVGCRYDGPRMALALEILEHSMVEFEGQYPEYILGKDFPE